MARIIIERVPMNGRRLLWWALVLVGITAVCLILWLLYYR